MVGGIDFIFPRIHSNGQKDEQTTADEEFGYQKPKDPHADDRGCDDAHGGGERFEDVVGVFDDCRHYQSAA